MAYRFAVGNDAFSIKVDDADEFATLMVAIFKKLGRDGLPGLQDAQDASVPTPAKQLRHLVEDRANVIRESGKKIGAGTGKALAIAVLKELLKSGSLDVGRVVAGNPRRMGSVSKLIKKATHKALGREVESVIYREDDRDGSWRLRAGVRSVKRVIATLEDWA